MSTNVMGGYIASLAGSTSGYDARFWVRPNPDASGTTFDIGFGPESSNPPFTSGTYNVNDVLFVVMAYNKDNNTVSTWINPDVSSFEGTIPVATLSSTDTSAPSSINLFILRQDSTGETPFVEIDALRISDNWADVTPKDATASVKNNQIEGFATYPNPVTSDNVTITSNSADKKEVAIFNVLGKKVVSRSFLGTKSQINIANLSSGIYILKVTEGTKTATSKLIIK
ncbi:MAG: T9SS type A sorting domain-containing protein [Polaribacter sp.]|nr:T9SS type A sorting domain-containing protein [Polaribacter sp.]